MLLSRGSLTAARFATFTSTTTRTRGLVHALYMTYNSLVAISCYLILHLCIYISDKELYFYSNLNAEPDQTRVSAPPYLLLGQFSGSKYVRSLGPRVR